MEKTMEWSQEQQQRPTPRTRRRSAVTIQVASVTLLCAAAVMLFGSNSTSNKVTRSDMVRLLKKVEKIKPGRKLQTEWLQSHLEVNPEPSTSGRQCETHFDKSTETWVDMKGDTNVQPVPAGSRFETNNNFFTRVDYNGLNIMVVGDSVGENIALFLENAHSRLKMYKNTRESYRAQTNLGGDTQDRIWVNHVPEDKGGGYVAFGRVLTMWHGQKAGADDFLLWDPRMFDDFRKEYGNVDVLIYRTPWPWMAKFGNTGNLSPNHYYRVLEVARRMVNPRTVIFATSAVNNNGIEDGFESLRNDNEVIRKFVETYEPPEDAAEGVQNVMLLDWERLTDSLVMANAEAMGIPKDMTFKHVLTGKGISEKRSFTGTNWFPQLTAMACAGTTTPRHPLKIATCEEDKRGRISPDGMHWCDATTGPRTAGGILCVANCAIVADEEMNNADAEVQKHISSQDFYDAEPQVRKQYLKQCQDECNALWMNMDSVFVEDGFRSGHLEV